MKKIVITVSDQKAAEILSLIIGEVDEITVTRIGPDIDAIPPEVKNRVPYATRYRGDKKATDILLEMYDERNKIRTFEEIKEHFINVGFSGNTASGAISKLVADYKVRRDSAGSVHIIDTSMFPPQELHL